MVAMNIKITKVGKPGLLFTLAMASALGGCTIIPAADPSRASVAYDRPVRGAPASRPAATVPYAPMANPAQPPADYYPPAPTQPAPPAQPYAPELPARPSGAPLTFAALGQTITVSGPRITPLEVLEDSRCPMNARCVWAGQVRLRLRIDSGTGGIVEITSGRPITVADGTLELVEIRPDKVAGAGKNGAVTASDYRFGFRFMGGY